MIYFIQATGGGPIKIGCAGNPWQRAATLQTGNPSKLVVLAVVHGDRAEEAALHALFASDRTQGEWFEPTPRLLYFIAGIQAAQRENPPIPMAVDDDMLLGLSREQMEAIAAAMDGRSLLQAANRLLDEHFDTSPLSADVVLAADSMLAKLESIESDIASLSDGTLLCEPQMVRGAAFFDTVSYYSRSDLILSLREMLSRHALSVAEAILSDETVLPFREAVHDDSSPVSDFTVN